MSVVSSELDGYHYIYGRKNEGIFRQAFLARCPFGEIYSEWEFHAGDDNWVSDATEADPILDDVSNSFSVFQRDNKYFLLTQERGFLQCGEGREIYMYAGDSPQGPFENKNVVYTIEDKFSGEYPVTYNAQAHPQFIENDELLISYNTNKICPDPCAVSPLDSNFDADMYRPKFAHISLSAVSTNVSDENSSHDLIFNVHPNPASTLLHIESQLAQSNNMTVEIYNLLGSIVIKEETQNAIDVSSLENGMYVIRITSGVYKQVELFTRLGNAE